MTLMGEGFGVAGALPLRARVALFAFSRPAATVRVLVAIRACSGALMNTVLNG